MMMKISLLSSSSSSSSSWNSFFCLFSFLFTSYIIAATTMCLALEDNNNDTSSSAGPYPVCRVDDESEYESNECHVAHAAVDCGVYMAPSTLGEDTNMGIYTGIDLNLGDVVKYPEIAIPLTFRDWGEHHETYLDGTLWDRYIWDHDVANIEPKTSDLQRVDKGAVFVPGVGCTINSRLDLHNIQSTAGSTYDTLGLHRSRDVGVGAYCPYHSSSTVVSRDVQAGSELFAQYGDNWIPEIPGAIVTFDETMDDADEFIEEYYEWMSTKEKEGDEYSEELQEALWNLTRSFGNGGTILTENYVMGALPREASWKDVKEHYEKSKVLKETLQKDQQIVQKSTLSTTRKFVDDLGRRSIQWLQRNGKCQDHLKPGPSTIKQAGRGAFASRFLPEGTVVGYSPLIHFGYMGEEILKLGENVYGENATPRDDLVLNYSFGHANSTILLTPYGAMVNYINHSRERANVRIQFPEVELVAHKPEWLTKSPSDFLRHLHEKIGLSFDYIALRDIEEDEEVFLDYGDEWIAAWEEHVQNWNPLVDNEEDYVHRTDWKESYLRTIDEDPYPSNLITLCTVNYQQQKGNDDDDNDTVTNLWIPLMMTTPERKYCDVLERRPYGNEDNYVYTVRIYLDKEKYEDDDGDDIVIVRDVPSPTGVELVDKLHSADYHLPEAFRHYIQIPDNILPEAWKNKG